MCSLPTIIVGARKRIIDFRRKLLSSSWKVLTVSNIPLTHILRFTNSPWTWTRLNRFNSLGIFWETSDETWKISICSLQKLSHCIKGMMNNSWKLCNRNSTFTLYSQYIEIYAEKWVTYDTDWSNCRQQDSFHNPPLHIIYCDGKEIVHIYHIFFASKFHILHYVVIS